MVFPDHTYFFIFTLNVAINYGLSVFLNCLLSFIFPLFANTSKQYIFTKKYLLKKIYDEVTEDILDMSNVRIFKKIEKKKWGCLYFVMSLVS